jgi:hypothetical protein
MPQRGDRGGRIVPPARDTDDSTPIRVTNLRPEDRDAIFHTTDLGKTKRVRQNYRARNREFIDFIFTQYPDSFEHTTIIVSAEAKSNANNYFYEKDIRDLLYTGLDPKLFQAFLSQKKYLKNGNGTLCSYSHLSKFYMAVKWGSTTASRHLPLSFYSEMDAYLVAFKKEHAAAKKEGKTDTLKWTPTLWLLRKNMLRPKKRVRPMKERLMQFPVLYSSC